MCAEKRDTNSSPTASPPTAASGPTNSQAAASAASPNLVSGTATPPSQQSTSTISSAQTNPTAAAKSWPKVSYEEVRNTCWQSTYVVQEGDTLSTIGATNGVAAEDIAVANGIENADLIQIGWELKIPPLCQ